MNLIGSSATAGVFGSPAEPVFNVDELMVAVAKLRQNLTSK